MSETETFQHYQVLRREDGSLWELGRGSMGITYKAFDTDLHCEVALKVVLPHVLHNEVFRQRFLREARLAARLRHPNIAAIFHLGQTADGTHFYAMEFCEGETLQQVVDRRGPLSAAAALPLVLQISRALTLANELGLVHRDIKPSNLILTQSPADGPVVKVIDFGLAKSYETEGSTWASMGTSGFIGTAHFASPEQLENEPVDGRSDIYSLGATLWFLLTGQSMFGGSLARIVSQHLSGPVPWMQLDAHGVPPSVRALLARTLEKKPADRFRDALELRHAVEECLAGLADNATRPIPVPAAEPADVHPASEGAGVTLANRWQLVERCGGGSGGALFRALDLRHGSRFVAVKILAARLAADPEVCGRLERTVNLQRAAPHEHLVQPLDFGKDGAGGRFLVTEWIEGFTLLAVLRARGTLTPPEVLRLLEALAAGFDHARQHGLTWLDWSKHQILFHFPGGFDDEQHRERTLHQPLASWPSHRVVLGTLPLEGSAADGDETLVNTQTRLPAPDDTDAVGASGDDPAAGLEITPLGRLIHELLGGNRVEDARGTSAARLHYVPLSSLTEAGNAVLRRAVWPAPGTAGFITGRELYEALENAVSPGTTRPVAATVPPGPPLPLAAEPIGGTEEERTPASRRRWPWLAMPTLLAVAGLVAYLGARHSSPPARTDKTHPAPTVSPARPASARSATPAPGPASTPLPALVAVPTPTPVPPVPALTPPPERASTDASTPALAGEATPTPGLPALSAENPAPLPNHEATPSPGGTTPAPEATEPPVSPEAAFPPVLSAAAPTPEPAAPASLPPLEGRLDRTESSPLGDLRLEYRQTDAGTSVWLISRADESRRRLLSRAAPDARALFSPDEQWLLFDGRSADSDSNGVQILRRDPADDALYQVPDEYQRPGAGLEDLAWGFYLGEVGLPPRTNREHVRIDAVDWQPDASAFTLRLVPSGPGGTAQVPVPWLCRYDLTARRFQAVTDVREVRAALAERAKTKAPPAAATPPATVRPAGDWQKLIGDFVDGFVRCDQTRDVQAALAYYAPSVDYFTDGRVSQAHIRSDILGFNQRWPTQRNHIVGSPDLRETKPGQSYSVRFRLAFSDESAPRKAWSRGESALELGIEIIRGVPLIVSIHEKSVRREKGTLPAR